MIGIACSFSPGIWVELVPHVHRAGLALRGCLFRNTKILSCSITSSLQIFGERSDFFPNLCGDAVGPRPCTQVKNSCGQILWPHHRLRGKVSVPAAVPESPESPENHEVWGCFRVRSIFGYFSIFSQGFSSLRRAAKMCLPDSDDFIQFLFGKMSLPFTAGRLLYQECALVDGWWCSSNKDGDLIKTI